MSELEDVQYFPVDLETGDMAMMDFRHPRDSIGFTD